MFLAMCAFAAAFVSLILVFFAVHQWARPLQLGLIIGGIVVTGGLSIWTGTMDAVR